MTWPKRPLIRYHGGEWRLAPCILQHLQPHRCYVEPFGGAADVLLQKPRAYAEVYNDSVGASGNLLRNSIRGFYRAVLMTTTFYARRNTKVVYEPISGSEVKVSIGCPITQRPRAASISARKSLAAEMVVRILKARFRALQACCRFFFAKGHCLGDLNEHTFELGKCIRCLPSSIYVAFLVNFLERLIDVRLNFLQRCWSLPMGRSYGLVFRIHFCDEKFTFRCGPNQFFHMVYSASELRGDRLSYFAQRSILFLCAYPGHSRLICSHTIRHKNRYYRAGGLCPRCQLSAALGNKIGLEKSGESNRKKERHGDHAEDQGEVSKRSTNSVGRHFAFKWPVVSGRKSYSRSVCDA